MDKELLEYLVGMELRIIESLKPPKKKYVPVDDDRVLSLAEWRKVFHIPEGALANLIKNEEIEVIMHSKKARAKRMFKRNQIEKFFSKLEDEDNAE